MTSRFALLGNHLPRQCGIATFTTQLADALDAARPGGLAAVIAVDDAGRHHRYPSRVRATIEEQHPDSYRRAADFLNVNQIDVLSVQHEYGIYGGRAGAHLLGLLRALRIPSVTTLHTVLAEPNDAQRAVMQALAHTCDRFVVMSASGADLLMRVYGLGHSQIDLIPHGIPHVPVDPSSKARLGMEGRTVLMTFGLLSRDKGIEYVIDALPAILAVRPDALYIVLGATHPHVITHEGEDYRLMLQARARQLGVADHVLFHDRFVSQEELIEFLSATDVYLTPYLNPEQITSGTLAYAAGAGTAVISTPYRYARELLADGRGRLVPFRDAEAIAHQVISILGDDEGRLEMGRRARAQGEHMSWSAVATRYLESFDRAAAHPRRPTARPAAARSAALRSGLPDLSLQHLRLMTDDTGLLQHALFTVPRYADGYCLDDNARGLLLMAELEDAGHSDPELVRTLGTRYLAFVAHAFDRESGRFRNFLSYERRWAETRGSEDSHGRAVWALGALASHARAPGRRGLARELLHAALPALEGFSSPRAWAYALLGLDLYLRTEPEHDDVVRCRAVLAARLLDLFARASEPGWPWFEPIVTYCNARLPQALIVAGHSMHRDDMKEAGYRSLDWLMSLHGTPDSPFAPIGSNGFFPKGGRPAAFDQQPVEACAAVSACLDAFIVDPETRWLDHAERAFGWFLGENHLHQWLFDPSTGGCRDGLHADRLNLNQGAEATVSFLLALHDWRRLESIRATAVAEQRDVVTV